MKIGDIVRLKSGSPKLTVVRFTPSGDSCVTVVRLTPSDDSYVTVAWIAYGTGVPYERDYPRDALRMDNER